MKTKRWMFLLTMALAGIIVAAVFYKQSQPTAETRTNAPFKQDKTRHGDVIKNKSHDASGHENEHVSERIIQISRKEMTEFGIEVAKAGPVKIQTYINLPGQVALNADRLAHVVPRVSGITRQVRFDFQFDVDGSTTASVVGFADFSAKPCVEFQHGVVSW